MRDKECLPVDSKKVPEFYKKLYPIMLGLFTLIIAFFWKDIKANKKGFLLFMIIVCSISWSWNIFVNNYPNEPTWNFAHYAISGIFFLKVSLEDYLFYPICFWLSLIIMKRINVLDFNYRYAKNDKIRYFLRWNLFPILIPIIMLVMSLLDIASLSITIWFMIPSWIIFICMYERSAFYKINFKQFLIICLIFIPLSALWDLHSTTFKLNWFGLVEWFYPKNNGMLNSNSWAWIGNSPLAITPYFSFCVLWMNYNLYLLIFENQFKLREKRENKHKDLIVKGYF